MKKSIMIMAFGLFATATFAQNAVLNVSQKEANIQDQKPIKLKQKLAVKQNKLEAEQQPARVLKTKTVSHKSAIKVKLDEE